MYTWLVSDLGWSLCDASNGMSEVARITFNANRHPLPAWVWTAGKFHGEVEVAHGSNGTPENTAAKGRVLVALGIPASLITSV